MTATKEFLLMYQKLRMYQRDWQFAPTNQNYKRMTEAQVIVDRYSRDLLRIDGMDKQYSKKMIRDVNGNCEVLKISA